MADVEQIRRQLDELRRKIARIDARYADAAPAPMELPDGEEVESALGRFWLMSKQWPSHHRHGTADVGALSELPGELLAVLSDDAGWESPPDKWAFIDTETTGLAGGSGTFAFLIGGGSITSHGFELKQWFMREHAEEPAALESFAQWLEQFDVLVTYNGRAFDVPLLETRYRLSRMRPPFDRLKHIDLLYGARRLWRLALESCRLVELEQRILGVERVGDVGGALIPTLYFDYLRTKNAGPLLPVFTHNATDILSLACLTAVVPSAFREPERLKHGAEMVGLARWLRNEGRVDEALLLMRDALRRPLDDALMYETLWHVAEMERKLGHHDEATAVYLELSTVGNRWQCAACERLAVHYEHREKRFAMALEMTREARRLEDSEDLEKREQRLLRKLGAAGSGRLL